MSEQIFSSDLANQRADMLIKGMKDGSIVKEQSPNSFCNFQGKVEYHDYLLYKTFVKSKLFDCIVRV